MLLSFWMKSDTDELHSSIISSKGVDSVLARLDANIIT